MKRVVMALWSFILVAAPAFAFQPAGQGEFVPVNPQTAQVDRLPAAPLVIGAYAFVWLALMLYVWSIWRRLSRVERDMHALARRSGEGSRAR